MAHCCGEAQRVEGHKEEVWAVVWRYACMHAIALLYHSVELDCGSNPTVEYQWWLCTTSAARHRGQWQ